MIEIEYLCPICKKPIEIKDLYSHSYCYSCHTKVPTEDIRCSICLSPICHFWGKTFCLNPNCPSYQDYDIVCVLEFNHCQKCNRKLCTFGKHLLNFPNKCLLYKRENKRLDNKKLNILTTTPNSFQKMLIERGFTILSEQE